MGLDINQVRIELIDIINRHPNKTGGDTDEYGEKSCVYFKDKDGTFISNVLEEYQNYDENRLAIPVCIVGQWVHDFHPELKKNQLFQNVLFKNAVLSSSLEAKQVLGEEVHDLLSEVQAQQDSLEVTWKDLDF